MPYIKEADAMPMEVEEGGDIPLGETSFGQKTVKVRKIGRGLQITDELLYESTIDFFSVFLRHFGIKLSIGKDMRALLTLINGDQDDLSEAAPVIGVENSGAFEMLDIDRVTTRMEALQQPYTSAVMKESIFNTDLNAALTSRERMTVKQYLPNSTTHEGMPANAILFVNRETALAELQYRGLTTVTHRNPAKQTNTLYVSTSVGYGKIMQTGAVLLTSAGEFSSANFKFPSSMDLEYLVSQDFKK
jgi:hypothetical protein